MEPRGIFIDDETKTEFYNRMLFHIDSASELDKELAARMRQKFRELRRVNREWDKLLDELAESVTNACAKKLAGQ